MLETYKGKVVKLGDNVDTNDIIATRFLIYTDPQKLKDYLFYEIDPGFTERIEPGSILVAGHNFGCGSSREHAAIVIKAAGFRAVVAESFARIFFRNSIAIGLPLIECPGIATECKQGDELEVDIRNSVVKVKDREMEGLKYPEFILDILEYEGLSNWIAENRDQVLKP